MTQPKVQLVAPLGNITVPGMNVTGVVTATIGDVGVAGSIIQGNNIDIGAGIITATSFVGDQIGTYRAASLTGSPDLVVGVVTSSGFVAQITGDVTGDLTGNVVGTAGSILSGKDLWVGIATATLVGPGQNLAGVAGSSFTHQTVTADGATTSIDLSAGHIITLNQSANTTLSISNAKTAQLITIIRIKDSNATSRTLAWPDSISWNGGTAPTLVDSNPSGGESDQIQLLTRDGGVKWYGWVTFSNNRVDQNLFVAGYNNFGKFGQNESSGTLARLSSPTQISGTNWRNGAMSDAHVLATKTDNTLWVWGGNQQGALGNNKANLAISSPTQISGSWSFAAAGNNNRSYAINTDGELWIWGKNEWGTLGLNQAPGTLAALSSPTQVGTDTTWSSAGDYAYYRNSWGIKTDATLWTWGQNQNGRGGGWLPDNVSKSSPTQIPGSWTAMSGSYASGLATKTDGTLWAWGYGAFGLLAQNNRSEYSSPRQIGTETTWNKIASGSYSNYATKTDGTLWGWGCSINGELGLNEHFSPSYSGRSSPVQIPGTTWETVINLGNKGVGAIKTDGTLWTWGNNEQGQLGINDRTQRSSPTQVPGTIWDTEAVIKPCPGSNGASHFILRKVQ